MLSVTNHDSMAATDYQDDGRPAKRPRQDNEHDDGLRTYSLATPGPSALNSEADHSGDGAAKKNKKRPLSCGECRRLKLKCDRVFPCQSCCKRGCAEICPEGALTGGKGSRFILANTEQLHEKIKAMSERIRQLEDALQVLHTQHSTEPHPLLRQELLLIKRSPELFGVDRNGMPSSTNSDNNRRDEDDRPSLASSSSPKDATEECTSSSYMSGIHVQTGIPEDIFRLSRAFPVPVSANVDLNPHLRQRLRDMLPPRSEGQRICEQAQHNAFWHYSPDTSESFIPNLVHSVYTTPLSGLLPHRLSLFFMILTIGTAVDCNPPQTQLTADRYHNLARAALCETAVIDDPSFDTVNTLFYMVWYLLMFSNHRRAVEQAWGIMGILSRLAQSLGLHRDGVRLKMIPEELEKRKALLWNMMNVDVRLATMLRRPPSMCIRHVDAKRPAYNSLDDSPFTSAGSTYHEWRDIFLSQCMIPVLDAIVSPVPPSYSDVLGLDAKIRDFEIPPILRLAENGGLAPRHPIGLQQSLTLSTREIAILNLHRCHFSQALSVPEEFNMKHKYAPSVMAVYISARTLIWSVLTTHRWEPDLVLRLSVVWSNCVSAAVALSLLVTCAPNCTLSSHALGELDKVKNLFSEVRGCSPTVAKAVPVLDILIAKALSAYANRHKGPHYSGEEGEVCKFARRIGLLVPTDGAQMEVDTDPFEHAHPSLRRYLEQYNSEVAMVHDPLLYSSHPSPSGIGMSRSYSTSAERTGHRGDPSHSSDAWTPQTNYNIGWLTSEFSDSTWMTWF